MKVLSAKKVDEKSQGKYDDYEVEQAARDLKAAEKVKQDPELLALAMKEIDKDAKVISSLSELKSVASKKINEAAMVKNGDKPEMDEE